MPDPPYIIDSDGSIRPGRTIGAGEIGELRLELTDLNFIRIDHQTRLQFGPFEVVIECPFVLRAGGTAVSLDPEDRATLGPLLSVYPDSLVSASIDETAALSLCFGSGTSIVVKQDPRYEAWQINGPENYLLVCRPGTTGRVSVWP